MLGFHLVCATVLSVLCLFHMVVWLILCPLWCPPWGEDHSLLLYILATLNRPFDTVCASIEHTNVAYPSYLRSGPSTPFGHGPSSPFHHIATHALHPYIQLTCRWDPLQQLKSLPAIMPGFYLNDWNFQASVYPVDKDALLSTCYVSECLSTAELLGFSNNSVHFAL
ncbi:hypothetical protein EDD17DRAFT_1504606 [Pisolithus thermaeus]|nr:hypothetical protein EDD17DRAFT_1504606 [Pisolithus thermaeus]